jgi:hypothetical protein
MRICSGCNGWVMGSVGSLSHGVCWVVESLGHGVKWDSQRVDAPERAAGNSSILIYQRRINAFEIGP